MVLLVLNLLLAFIQNNKLISIVEDSLKLIKFVAIMKNKVFLGGTCNESTWREELIPLLKIDYFNPVVEDWTPECQAEEERQKNEECNYQLYVITPKMTGVFSIAELIESAITRKNNTIFCIIPKDGNLEFDKGQIRSLNAVGNMVKKYNGIWCQSLEEVANYLNNSNN